VTPVTLLSMQRAIERMPDVALRDRWLTCAWRTPFYYLALAELTGTRNYHASTLYRDRWDLVHHTSDYVEPYGQWLNDGAY
jgi:hypothetical protein